jgi:hypothetical protein
MEIALTLAVAAKGACDPQSFIDALVADGIIVAPNVDVHIAHDCTWPIEPDAMPDNVTLHPCPLGTSILKLWGVALARSTGQYVAVLDINCPPATGWLNSVLLEIGKGSALFFGPVDFGWDKTDRRIVGYLAEYAQFNSPLAVELDEVPGNNLVCQRSLLEGTEKLQTEGFFKTFMVWRLEAEQKLMPERINDMIVNYRKPFRFRHYINRRFIHGRCFGATRHDNAGQPPRLLCLGFTILLPLLRIWRIYRVVRYRSGLKSAFYRFILLIISSEIAWSAGEFSGYAFGGRNYCNKLD